MKQLKLVIVCIAVCMVHSTSPITLLYSMKIRRIFGGAREALGKEGEAICAFTAVPIVSTRSRHFFGCEPAVDIREKRILIGSLFDFRCSLSDNIWFDITTGIANERAKAKGCSDSPLLPVFDEISKTNIDDITFEAGYHLFPTEHAQMDFYFLAGFPTHRKVTCEDALGTFVGTRFFSLGVGAEFSYSFCEDITRSIVAIMQTRYLHFFNRNWDPILPCGGRIQPGDLVDILVALRYREKQETIEVGYNPTFFLNQALIFPGITGKVRSEEFVRNGAYIKYAHLFLNKRHPVSLGCGFAFSRAPVLESRVYDGWISVSVVF